MNHPNSERITDLILDANELGYSGWVLHRQTVRRTGVGGKAIEQRRARDSNLLTVSRIFRRDPNPWSIVLGVSEFVTEADACASANSTRTGFIRKPGSNIQPLEEEAIDPNLVDRFACVSGFGIQFFKRDASRKGSEKFLACTQTKYRVICDISKTEAEVTWDEVGDVVERQLNKIRLIGDAGAGKPS